MEAVKLSSKFKEEYPDYQCNGWTCLHSQFKSFPKMSSQLMKCYLLNIYYVSNSVPETDYIKEGKREFLISKSLELETWVH